MQFFSHTCPLLTSQFLLMCIIYDLNAVVPGSKCPTTTNPNCMLTFVAIIKLFRFFLCFQSNPLQVEIIRLGKNWTFPNEGFREDHLIKRAAVLWLPGREKVTRLAELFLLTKIVWYGLFGIRMFFFITLSADMLLLQSSIITVRRLDLEKVTIMHVVQECAVSDACTAVQETQWGRGLPQQTVHPGHIRSSHHMQR